MLSALYLLAYAHAAEPEFADFAEEEEEEEGEPVAIGTTASVGLGGSATNGNAVAYTLNGIANAKQRWLTDQLAAVVGVNVGRAIVDSDESGNLSAPERRVGTVEIERKYFAETRYDRFFGEKNSLYALGGGLVAPFAGYELRTHEQLGYSRVLSTSETTVVVGEGGADYAQELYVAGVDPAYSGVLAARLMLGIEHQFNDSLSFTNAIEIYENVLVVEDIRMLNVFSFSAAASDHLSLKISHNLAFDNQPVDGFQTLDQTTLFTLVATLL